MTAVSALHKAGERVVEALGAIDDFDETIERAGGRPGDVAQAVLIVGTAVVLAIRELGLRLEAMGE